VPDDASLQGSCVFQQPAKKKAKEKNYKRPLI
jgi:hypothetical protein